MKKALIDQMAEVVAEWGPFNVKYHGSEWCVQMQVGKRILYVPIQILMETSFVMNVTCKELLKDIFEGERSAQKLMAENAASEELYQHMMNEMGCPW